MRIGICGGTFDPIHRGHLDPILAVCETMQWERILYVPAYVQPFKAGKEAASPFHRFAMTVLATQPYDVMRVSAQELERGAISYTVDTLTQLRSELPDAAFDWIIGDDNLGDLARWKSIESIATLANFVVLSRVQAPDAFQPPPGFTLTSIRDRGRSGAVVFARNETVPVSSTDIRLRLRTGQSIEELVPPPVSRYIHQYGLYRKGHS